MAPNNPQTNRTFFKISAPGKVILHGEHSVVYHKLALAASLGLRTRLNYAESPEDGSITLELPKINLLHHYTLNDLNELLHSQPVPVWKSQNNFNFTTPELVDHGRLVDYVQKFIHDQSGSEPLNFKQMSALSAFFYLMVGILGGVNLKLVPFHLRIETDLTISAGTGSSASFSVVIAAFLLHLIKLKNGTIKHGYKTKKLDLTVDKTGFDKADLDLISRWAFMAEKIIHGNPSGVDNSVCTYGSFVEFRRDSAPKHLSITKKFNLILVNTQVSRDTKVLVEKAAQLHAKHPTVVAFIFESMEEITKSAICYLKKINEEVSGDYEMTDYYNRLAELAEINQGLLCSLGAGHPKLAEACTILAERGLKAKLTGAGGGGYAICLTPPSFDQNVIDQVIAELNAKGFLAIFTDLGGAGVTVD